MSAKILNEVFILDGGLGTQLQRQGYNAESDPLFGSSLLLDNHQAIFDAHTSFLEHGSDIICTATYQASVQSLSSILNISVDEAKLLIQKAVQTARNACNEFWATTSPKSKYFDRQKPQVAGSVGPFGASLADGSEYHGAYIDTISQEELKDWHRPRLECLVAAGVDYVALETIPAAQEGEVVVQLLKEFPSTKAWLSFSCKDEHHTCHGEKFDDAIKRCLRHDSGHQIVAVGVNCTNPNFVSDLLERGKCASGLVPFVAYPNSGESWTRAKKWQGKDNCAQIQSFVPEWVELGVRYVGGCCRVTHEDIGAIRKAVYGK